jgi:integrase
MPAMGRRPTKNLNLPPRMRKRVSSSGTAFYYYDTGGKPRREIPLGSDYVLAMRKWSDLEQNGVAPLEVTFAVVAERYRREVIPKKASRTQKDNERELNELLAFFNNPPAPLDGIRPVHVRQYLDRRRDAPIRANREKALLSHIWNKAREWGYTDRENPCRGVQGFTEKGRDVYVEDEVYKAVWDAADPMVRDGMDLAYLTGQRVSDVLAMTETALRGGMLEVRQAKTGKRLRIALSGELGAVVARARERRPKGEGQVRSLHLVVAEDGQPLTYSGFIQRFQDARAAAAAKEDNARIAPAILGFQFRDLRAKAGTDKADSAGDIRQAQRQLGHSSVVMTEHYVRNRRGDKVDPTR